MPELGVPNIADKYSENYAGGVFFYMELGFNTYDTIFWFQINWLDLSGQFKSQTWN